jgi:hypothetical protein
MRDGQVETDERNDKVEEGPLRPAGAGEPEFLAADGIMAPGVTTPGGERS